MIISCLSQKGGVGKSAIARTLAVEFTRAKWNTLLADTDNSQSTSKRWASKRRDAANIKPKINAEVFSVTAQALKASNNYDITIIDGAPHSTAGTLEAASASDLVLLPSGTSVDDLETQLGLAVEIREQLPNCNIRFAIYLAMTDAQAREAKETVNGFGFTTFNTHLLRKVGYEKALDVGYCITESRYKSQRNEASLLINEVVACVQ